LAPLNVAARGFLDGTKRYEEQRARADDLADRDEFRNAVVNSLQEGFFVSDKSGAITEFNDAFAKLTGYPAQGLPYRWPYPWLVDEKAAWQQQSRWRKRRCTSASDDHDDGSWKPKAADPGVRGRGLLLIRAVSDWLEMECTSSGTTVDMSFNLSA
jgi:PAS domain-containing protein